MTRRALLFLLLGLVALWSAAALAQGAAAGQDLPSQLLDGGSTITWPGAIVMCAWLADRALRSSVSQVTSMLERCADRIVDRGVTVQIQQRPPQ